MPNGIEVWTIGSLIINTDKDSGFKFNRRSKNSPISFVVSVRLCGCNNSKTVRQIVKKCYIGESR
jgi:hypothetical protein